MRRLIHGLLDQVKPRTPRLRLIDAWDALESEYHALTSLSDEELRDPLVVAHSNLQQRLVDLVLVVRDEADDPEITELLVEAGMVAKICSIGFPDRPSGIRPVVIQALGDLVRATDPSSQMLPHSAFHEPLVQMIQIAVESGDLNDSEKAERVSSLIHAISLKIRSRPELAAIFLMNVNQGKSPKLGLLEALEIMIEGEKEYSLVARQALLYLVQTNSEMVSKQLLDSSLSGKIVGQLVAKYEALDKRFDYETFLDQSAEFREKQIMSIKTFLNWLDYINQLAEDSLSSFSSGLARVVKNIFLQALRSDLLHMEEVIVRSATLYLRKFILPRFDAPCLRLVAIQFLLDNDEPINSTGRPAERKSLNTVLVKRIHDLSEDLSLETLALFDNLVGLKDPYVAEKLVLTYLRQLDHSTELKPKSDSTLDVSIPAFLKTFPDIEASKVLSNLNAYLVDANNRMTCWEKACTSRNSQITSGRVSERDELDQEGIFLHAIFQKLSRVLTNSFATNLRLTSIISCLACHHDALVHSYFLDPDWHSCSHHMRTLPQVLLDCWERAMKQKHKIHQFERRLEDARLHLDENTRMMVETMDQELYFQGVIVLHEFIKELTAIEIAKKNFNSSP